MPQTVVPLPDEATASRLLTDLTAAKAQVISFGPAAGGSRPPTSPRMPPIVKEPCDEHTSPSP